MEACFSQLTLDVIGKAVFNYDFNALTTDSPLIQAGHLLQWRLFCPHLERRCPCVTYVKSLEMQHGFLLCKPLTEWHAPH